MSRSSLSVLQGRRRFVFLFAALLALTPIPAHVVFAQTATATAETHARGDLSGNWQGTLQAGKALRLITTFAKADKGFTGKFYTIDQSSQAFEISHIAVDGSQVKFSISVASAEYSGTLSADGASIVGTWSQGGQPLPLTLVRATRETAWEIPAPAPPAARMAADADPAFDVATIKPNPDATSMQGLVIQGRNFVTKGTSLADLISFAYEVQKKQIVGGPEWVDKDRYDINATPDAPGAPNPAQLRVMIRKLLAERWKLTFHKDTREMPAFVLTVAKGGPKLKPTELTGPLPGLSVQPGVGGLKMIVRNGTVGDLTQFLQLSALDRPVVDQTGIKGKYDIDVTFTPDDSLFGGRLPPPTKTEGVEPAPMFFDAFQQQLGLKLDAQRTGVPVIAIDKVEKPSAN